VSRRELEHGLGHDEQGEHMSKGNMMSTCKYFHAKNINQEAQLFLVDHI
jgi:hypothetical protein